MLKFTSVLAAAGFAMLPLASQAATPTLGDVLKASGISANGYVDFGSTWNNRGADGVGGIGGLQGAKNASFRLNQVGLAVTTATSEGFSGTLDLLAGQDALGYGGNNGGGDIILKQAYAQYTNGGFTVLGGRFVTLAGFEVVNSSQNQNATRGLLFTILQPTNHTGVRASYTINKVVTLTGGYNNSVNGLTTDNNTQKTLEAQVAVSPFDGFNNALTFYYGTETASNNAPNAPFAGMNNNKFNPYLVDLVSSLQVTKALSLGLNYDYAYDQPFAPTISVGGAAPTGAVTAASGNGARSHGIASYASFQICNDLRLGGRAEYITTSFNQGVLSPTDSRVNQFEYTLTSDYAVTKNFSVLSDVRFDKQIGPNGYTPGTRFAGTTTTLGGFAPSNASNGGGNAMTSVTIKGIYRF